MEKVLVRLFAWDIWWWGVLWVLCQYSIKYMYTSPLHIHTHTRARRSRFSRSERSCECMPYAHTDTHTITSFLIQIQTTRLHGSKVFLPSFLKKLFLSSFPIAIHCQCARLRWNIISPQIHSIYFLRTPSLCRNSDFVSPSTSMSPSSMVRFHIVRFGMEAPFLRFYATVSSSLPGLFSIHCKQTQNLSRSMVFAFHYDVVLMCTAPHRTDAMLTLYFR